jgi:5'-nucleotidase
MDAPDLQRNREGAPVLIHQVGWGGQRLGKIEMAFERNKPGRCVTCDGIWVQPTPAKRLKAH